MPDNTNQQLPNWISAKTDGTVLTLKATPRASRSELCGAEDEWLKVRLKAPPVDGKANRELISFFAKLLKVPKSRVEICSGESSRLKRISIKNIPPEQVLPALF
jgi:hypothetical protein